MTTLPLSPDELLTTTRSVRKRLDLTRPVPLELVKECLEVALQAPTGRQPAGLALAGGHRPGAACRHRRVLQAVLRRATAARGGTTVGTTRARHATQQRVASSSDHLADHMAEVPVLVLACIEAAAELPAENQAGLWGSLLPAAWSYQLAARARGLGTAWTTLHLSYEREVAELLGIPAHVRQGVLLPTAYYTGETFRPAPREPLESVLHVDRW